MLVPLNPKEIPIEGVYTRLTIIGEAGQKDKREHAEQAKAELGSLGYEVVPTHEAIFEPKQAIELEELFEHEMLKGKPQKRVLIQGSAGIGKSTLCHHIAYRWAQEKDGLFQEFKYVFWLKLRNLSEKHLLNERSLIQYIAQECGISKEYLGFLLKNEDEKNKTLVLLDGYDELSPEAINSGGTLYPILAELKAFPNVLITTRPQYVDFEQDCNLEILGFDAEGVKYYVSHFFSENQENQTQQQKDQAKALREQLKNPLVRSLSRIPINLEIFCSLVALGLPINTSNMTSLYFQLTNWLFERFITHPAGQGKIPHRAQMVALARQDEHVRPLEEVAWEAMELNTLYLNAESVVDILKDFGISHEQQITRIGPLRLEEDGKCVFIHLTFQEYFAAAKLARLYTTDPMEARKCLERIKFEPRYVLVLKMVAGHLSMQHLKKQTNEKTLLQVFFDDLFSEPRDLAVSYGLRLQALCFEECEKPENIFQYNDFIEQAVNFLNVCINPQLIVDLLTGNNRLFTHEKVIADFVDQIQNPKKQLNAMYTLMALIRWGQVLPSKILKALTLCLKKYNLEMYVKSKIAMVLRTIVQSGQALPTETIEALITCLTEPKGDHYAKPEVAKALEAIARSGQTLPPKAIEAFIACLRNSKEDDLAKHAAAEALGTVSQSNQILLPIVFEVLIARLNDLKVSWYVKSGAAAALEVVAKSGKVLPSEALQALGRCLIDSKIDDNDSYAKSRIANTLKTVAKNGQDLPFKVIKALIACFSASNIDNHAKSCAVSALIAVIKSGQALSFKAIKNLIEYFSNSYTNGHAKSCAASVLKAVIKSGKALPPKVFERIIDRLTGLYESSQTLSPRILEKLIAKLTDSKATNDTKAEVIFKLKTVVQNGQQVPPAALESLISCLTDPQIYDSIKLVADSKYESREPRSPEDLESLIACIKGPYSLDKRVAVGRLWQMAKNGQLLPPKVINVLIFCRTDPQTYDIIKSTAVSALKAVAENKQALPPEALEWFTDCIVGPKKWPLIRSEAVSALKAVAENKQALPPEALEALASTLCIPKGVYNHDASEAVSALEEVCKNGRTSNPEVLEALSEILIDPQTDEIFRHQVFTALVAIVKSNQILPLKALNALIGCLTDPKTAEHVISDVTDVLEIVIQTGQVLSLEILQELIHAIDIRSNSFETKSVLDLLNIISMNLNHKLNNKNYKILAKLFFLTNRVLFYQEGKFYATSKYNKISSNDEIKISLEEGTNPEELYHLLLQEKV